ncbi:MAG: iron-sulfur cluster assembly accessory protein [Opitutaceae bacterium]|nr:iron-sulfur cluster assembly accessory protein [Opitutaceae bacterium]
MTVDTLTSPAVTPPPVTAPTAPGRVLPEGVRAGSEALVRLTESAGKKVKSLIAREAKGDWLRIAISGGGCNGLSYKLRFVAEPKRGDILVTTGGADVLVDPKTALYLKGTVLDYSHQMVGGGFKFANPNAKASCSCGESFSV